jgi:hypothetical protein
MHLHQGLSLLNTCQVLSLDLSDNIDYVSSILEWLRKRVLATGWDEGRGDSCLGILGDH